MNSASKCPGYGVYLSREGAVANIFALRDSSLNAFLHSDIGGGT